MMKRATTAFANALKIPQLCSVRFEDIQAPLGFQLNEDQQVLKNAISVKSTWTQSSIASGSKVSFTRLDLCVQNKISERWKAKIYWGTLSLKNAICGALSVTQQISNPWEPDKIYGHPLSTDTFWSIVSQAVCMVKVDILA